MHLIPFRIDGSGIVWDTSKAEITLRVGQRLYLDKPIIIEQGMDFLFITRQVLEGNRGLVA